MPRLPSQLRASSSRLGVLLIGAAVLLVVAVPAPPAVAAPPRWIRDIDAAIAGRDVSVAIGLDGTWLLRRGAWRPRTPASNQKLLFSIALLHRTSLGTRIRTQVFAKGPRTGGTLDGTLWIVGRGDPTVEKPAIAALARAVREAGIRRVRRVMGSTSGFQRDWWAAGWQDYFPRDFIPLPTALTFEGNEDERGTHIRDPERRAARSLTNKLEALGVRVAEPAGAGTAPAGLPHVATVRSDPFEIVLRQMNRWSRNFSAEVLGKWFGRLAFGGDGSIAKGARAIERFAAARGISVDAYDASGLSYRNRIRPQDLVRLLWYAETRPWGDELRTGLAGGGQGTLDERLLGVQVRAKTGTLIDISTLSGWVWLEREARWGEFSIMSHGMSKSEAVAIEDRIVRIVSNRAFLPASASFPVDGEGSMLVA